MSDNCGGELAALEIVIEACRAQASALDMPALAYLLDKAAASLAVHVVEAGQASARDGRPRAPSTAH